MSLVTSACLYVQHASREERTKLLEPLPFDSRGQSFREVPWQASGGHKGMSCDVFLAGFNFVLPDDLVRHVGEVLEPRRSAVLIVDMEDDPDVFVFGEDVTVRGHGREAA
jgi:hypothetical protein